ncbi:MAG: hypothetical protein DWQ01_22145 [Planctomycetota bacterium]|nr:MAG: hypothetical protein DWQ01_22145 [Planctomycetota bacterium]
MNRNLLSLHQAPAVLLWILLGLALGRWFFPQTAQAQTADSGDRYVAVTGPFQEGVSLLYVLDQKTQRLAVYQAKGGAPNSREVVFVAARDISLDTLVATLNDESEYSPEELREWFQSRDLAVPERTGPTSTDPVKPPNDG